MWWIYGYHLMPDRSKRPHVGWFCHEDLIISLILVLSPLWAPPFSISNLSNQTHHHKLESKYCKYHEMRVCSFKLLKMSVKSELAKIICHYCRIKVKRIYHLATIYIKRTSSLILSLSRKDSEAELGLKVSTAVWFTVKGDDKDLSLSKLFWIILCIPTLSILWEI